MDCFSTYFTHVQTCDVTRVQSAGIHRKIQKVAAAAGVVVVVAAAGVVVVVVVVVVVGSQ